MTAHVGESSFSTLGTHHSRPRPGVGRTMTPPGRPRRRCPQEPARWWGAPSTTDTGALGTRGDFTEYVTVLRTAQKRKQNLMTLMDEHRR